MESATVIEAQEPTLAAPAEAKRPGITWEQIVASPLFIPVLALTGGLLFLYWHLIGGLPKLWLSEDGYYSHGFLVPVIAGYVVYRWQDKLKSIPARFDPIAIVPLALLVYLGFVSQVTNIQAIMSISFLLTALATIWLVAGFRWMFALGLPVLYLIFALPVFTGAIEFYTNPMQIISTQIAYGMLQAFGFTPYRPPGDATTIILNNFMLNVEVPCSGLKLLLAVSAFTVFFMMISGLGWVKNFVMALLVVPLCLFINSLRITLIGVVGDYYGRDAGLAFHDWSGYITLILCFFILFSIARGLGWKD